MKLRGIEVNWPMIAIYAVFFVSFGLSVRNRIRYFDVANWPSVPAENVVERGSTYSYPLETKHGHSSTTVDGRFVEYDYWVDSVKYHGQRVSPDGGGLPYKPGNRPWLAYYKASAPAISVLNPVPYQGLGWLVTSVFSGILAGFHAIFLIKDRSHR